MSRASLVAPVLLLSSTIAYAQGGSSAPTSPPASSAEASRQVSQTLTLDGLAARVEAELRASREHLEAVRDASVFSNRMFVALGGLLTVFGIATWIKQRRLDNELEARLKESERQRTEIHNKTITAAIGEEKRRGEVHSQALEILTAHAATAREEASRIPKLLDLQHENIVKINVLTAAVAAGAKENVETINKMFTAIASILEFKAQEARDVQGILAKMQAWRDERESEEQQELDDLKEMARTLRKSRHVYARPGPELSVRLEGFAKEFDHIGDRALYRLTKAKSPSLADVSNAEVFLRRGTIAYYANDVIKARSMFRVADGFFAPLQSDPSQAPTELKRLRAFVQFYEALIEKNYGDMVLARELITESWLLHGKGSEREFLTPVVRAEILAALGDVEGVRSSLDDVVAAVTELRKGGLVLPAHEAVYVARAHLIYGDSYYNVQLWDKACQHYEQALNESRAAASSEDVQRTDNYYALYALSQVREQRGEADEAKSDRLRAYDSLVQSQDLSTKRALDTQILLNALAYYCTRAENPDQAREYRVRVVQLWSSIVAVDNLELRLFSLQQKKQVPKTVFIQDFM